MAFDPKRQSYGRLPPFDKTEISISDRVAVDTDNAVVSSEDESDSVKSKPSLPPLTLPKGPRRTSFLSELQPESKRKLSFGPLPGPSAGLQSPTLSADTNISPWGIGSTLTRVPSNGAWGATNNSIWKEPPGPIAPPQTRSGSMSLKENDIIPFSIPLHPTPKTYRSQSYSVGQLEADLARATSGTVKKSSRLHEVEHASALAEVHEGEDEGSDAGVSLISRPVHIALSYSPLAPPVSTNQSHDIGYQGALVGLAEHSTSPSDTRGQSMLNDLETLSNLQGGNVPRPHWQTSFRMDRMDDGSASRRHSLAEVPTRRGSLAADAPPFRQGAVAYGGVTSGSGTYDEQAASNMETSMVQSDLQSRNYARGYFAGSVPAIRSQIESTLPEAGLPMQRSFAGQRQGLYQHNLFNRPGFDTPLYIVAFKCARADIYYIQPQTGLEVNEGDLVMVEADRGFDLGTVTHARVSWPRARELKEKALDEHFRWLMMFSRHNVNLASPEASNSRGLLASKGPRERDPTRKTREDMGMGVNDPAYSHEIKPRLIKRRATSHEIASLVEKEGNEAKAKRACQQKAREHNCEMEILDAEFQIDWKKLTFYFYAEHYVNFNTLVTDLYKVYKVRIWMSAINPQTYPSPANKPPSTIGPGAMQGRDTPMDQQLAIYHDPDPFGALPPSLNPASDTFKELHSATTQPSRGLDPNSGSFTSQWAHNRGGPPPTQQLFQPGGFQPPRQGQRDAWNGSTGFANVQSQSQAPLTATGYRDMPGQTPTVYGGRPTNEVNQFALATPPQRAPGLGAHLQFTGLGPFSSFSSSAGSGEHEHFAGLGSPHRFTGLGATQSFSPAGQHTSPFANYSHAQSPRPGNNQGSTVHRQQESRTIPSAGLEATFGNMNLLGQDQKE